ncbi:MAG: class I SAM-dependent methyltransferase [Cytophagales bacterium]|nr:class I SAM-dependent methyltransferase [Armatimonadota bacterium]
MEDALDVGCGTGLSTRALKALAHRVVGTDISKEMLQQAAALDGDTLHVESPAERLPFENGSFDLVTVSLAFHWFERELFLAQAHQLLRPRGWLIIYNNGFYGRMGENPAFEHWNRDIYLSRYPSPPRKDQPLTDAEAESSGFIFVGRETYTNEVHFTAEQLAAYLLTQSNTIAALEQGSETLDVLNQWLEEQLPPLFPAPVGTFAFGGRIWYLQRGPDAAVL